MVVWRCLLGVLVFAGAATAAASDRPFMGTNSAAAEEDDDNVWSVESWLARRGGLRTLSIAPEYAFNPTNSVQLELTRARDRDAGPTQLDAEIEVKHLFNHIARDGYGLGVVAALAWRKSGDGGWRRAGAALNMPFSWAFAEGSALLHINGGIDKAVGERRTWTRSVALQGEVARRTTLFAELAREGGDKLVHAGVRWWAQREKLALDLSWQRTRNDDGRASGIVVGIGFYDL